jgi:hypothetical protein
MGTLQSSHNIPLKRKGYTVHFNLDLKIREISLKNPFSQRGEEEKLSSLDVFCHERITNLF